MKKSFEQNSINKGCCEKCKQDPNDLTSVFDDCPCHSDKPVEEGVKINEYPLKYANTGIGQVRTDGTTPPTKAPSWETELIKVLGYSILKPEQVGLLLPWLVDFIRKIISLALNSERTRLLEGLGKMRQETDIDKAMGRIVAPQEQVTNNLFIGNATELLKIMKDANITMDRNRTKTIHIEAKKEEE